MSTILRALKKLEHDKATRKPDPTEMDLEFLDSTPPAHRRSPLKLILTVGLLICGASGATYLFMGGTENKPAPSPPIPPQVRQAAFKPVTTAKPAVSVLAHSSSATSPPAVPLQAEQKPVTTLPAAKPPQAITKESPPKQVPAAKQHVPQTPKAPKAQLQAPSHPSLTVNGIALSDGEKRKAIVNGMSVSVGSVIEGARVEEILGNRVRFSHGGKTFEISVGNTGP